MSLTRTSSDAYPLPGGIVFYPVWYVSSYAGLRQDLHRVNLALYKTMLLRVRFNV